MQDVIDQMYEVESKVIEYKQTGSRTNFPEFFDLSDRMETRELCSIIDSYQVGQSRDCDEYYKGPKEQGLAAGLSYYIDYHVLFSQQIKTTDFENETAMTLLRNDEGLSFPASYLLIYLQSALEQQLIKYHDEAQSFYSLISTISLLKGIGFCVIYSLLYILILMNLLNRLKMEIWLGHGLLHMIPSFVLENNMKVQQDILHITNHT